MLAHATYLTDPRIRREAEALAQRGYEIHVISLAEARRGVREPVTATVQGVHVHRLPVMRKRGSLLRYVYEYSMVGFLGGLKLAALRFHGRIDIVHIHNMPDILVLAGIFPRLFGSKIVLDVHDPSPELYMSQGHGPRSPGVRLLRIQERIGCLLADRVVSVNETMRENLHAKGVPDRKIFIVHNFPDHAYFQVCEETLPWPRKKGALTLLYCGTVTEHYDLGLAIKAIARLKGEVSIKFRIMGDGNKLRDVLDLASELGVRDSVELVGKVPIEKVAEEMRKADIGISCHRAGIFGDLYFSTKIIEYLTQGLCVLSPRTYTINKYLSDDSVFFFEPGNNQSLENTIRYVFANPAEVGRRLTNARQHLSRLSWQAEKKGFLGFYDGLLDGAADL
jgi:glycosyltransferase involved in cell wall biosynthesis